MIGRSRFRAGHPVAPALSMLFALVVSGDLETSIPTIRSVSTDIFSNENSGLEGSMAGGTK